MKTVALFGTVLTSAGAFLNIAKGDALGLSALMLSAAVLLGVCYFITSRESKELPKPGAET